MGSYRGGRGDGPPSIDGMYSVKVDNLHFNTSIVELREMFERYGEIGDVYIPRDRRNQQGRGFGFVRFLRRRDAEHATDRMDGRKVGGRELRCNIAKYNRPIDDRETRRRGGGEGSSGYGGRRGRSHSRSRSPPRRGRSRSGSPVRRKRSADDDKAGDISPKRSRQPSGGSEKRKNGDSRSPSPRSDRARGRRASRSPRRNGSERSGSS